MTSAEGDLHPHGAAAGLGFDGSDGEHTAGRHLTATPVPVGSKRSELPHCDASDTHSDHPARPQRSATHTLAPHPGHGRRSVSRSTAADGTKSLFKCAISILSTNLLQIYLKVQLKEYFKYKN